MRRAHSGLETPDWQASSGSVKISTELRRAFFERDPVSSLEFRFRAQPLGNDFANEP